MKSYILVLSLLFFLMGTGCGSSTKQPTDAAGADTAAALVPSAAPVGDYRFEKHYRTPLQDTVLLDTMYLELHLEAGQATGRYLWLIPEKDGKFGHLSGTVVQDTIRGQYAYQQEGGHYTDSIRIVLDGDQAIVTQYNAPQSQLIDTLLRQ